MIGYSAPPEDVGLEAERLFDSGFFCAESVVVAIARSQDVQSELLTPMATGFCSGIGRTDGMCGALAGAVLGLGLVLGRRAGSETVEPCYAAVQTLLGQFENEFGSTNCSVLLGCRLSTPEGQSTFRQQKLGRRCRTFTRRAAELASSTIAGCRAQNPGTP